MSFHCCTLLLASLFLVAQSTPAQARKPIPASEISALQTQLSKAKQSSSSARKRLGIRRVIRACEDLLEKHSDSPNRFEVLGVLYDTQQTQLTLDRSSTNRRDFLATCRALAQAPNEYAEQRLDAELLLTQAELAQQGADQKARANALKTLVQRYLGTSVETKAVRISLTMAIEMGNASLIGDLREIIAENFPGDLEMISFLRDKLAGQVFGAPFIGTFKRSDGKLARFPLDGMGKTTAMYFWSQEDGGIEQLKNLAEGWKTIPADKDPDLRYQFISFNLDGLPDAGESILREIGLDWPAMHFPGGRDSSIYKTYVRNDPLLLTMTPTGYTAMVMSGSTRPSKGWERLFNSALARSWARSEYASQIQSLLVGEFLVVDPTGEFDPAAPPEWKAAAAVDSKLKPLQRKGSSVPLKTLNTIQDCFVKPPMRFQLTSQELRANYAKAEKLCNEAIAAHADADDLWIVRNRRIVALLGLWKIDGQRKHFDAALHEAKAAIDADMPSGADIVARFCRVRETLRTPDADLRDAIHAFCPCQRQATLHRVCQRARIASRSRNWRPQTARTLSTPESRRARSNPRVVERDLGIDGPIPPILALSPAVYSRLDLWTAPRLFSRHRNA